ncbi:MAG: sigma-70 family RNA polymerase sigma factor [Ferruginibacter sp.]
MDAALQHILLGCKENERTAQKALYDRYCNLFMSICLRYVESKAEAEEALHNAFLRIFKHINKYTGQGSFEGWMKKIVVNCCLTYISKAGYQAKTKIISIQTGNSIAYGGILDIEDSCSPEDKHDKEYLLYLLQNLPETTRLVFNLYVFEEYNHAEIAEILSIAERTSQSHLAKARKILSAELDKKKLMSKMLRV